MNVIAVDVGTASVRLAIISFRGEQNNEVNVLASQEQDVAYLQDGLKFEQSSREVWTSICECSKACLAKSDVNPLSIKGIAFSATCSLVVESAHNDGDRNDIIMWMDHRAIEEAQSITQDGSKVLEQFGGICSPEFSLAKIVWLKNNAPERFESASGIFELPDWLVYMCIKGDPATCPRSLCCLTCKWGYDAVLDCHCDIVKAFGPKTSDKMGKSVLGPGKVAGILHPDSAKKLGLLPPGNELSNKENTIRPEVVVGTSLIDAHSGMLAMLSVPLVNFGIDLKIDTTFCSLAGTSTCHMLLSPNRNFTKGIWGPYKDVILQGYYLLEAGQSLTGKLIEICIESHQEGKRLLDAGLTKREIIRNLNEQIAAGNFKSQLHVLPTFHGNRSPLANPRLKGGVYGLSTEGNDSLIEHYLATVESIVYETKLIVETLGIKLDTVLVSGGLMKNKLYMQTLADVLACKTVKLSLESVDFMVMGSGLVARQAVINSLNDSDCIRPLTVASIENIQVKQLDAKIYRPRMDRLTYHMTRYLCYKEFVDFSLKIDKILKG